MKYNLAFDVGGSNVKYAVVNEEAEIIEKGKSPVYKDNIDQFINSIVEIVSSYKIKYELIGIAMSCPGAVNNETGFIAGDSAVPCIHGPNIRELLEGATGLRVSLENDANCAALAEVWRGVAKDVKDALFIVIGTGIGGAIIKDKRLHTGKHLYGGEFGFMLMETDYENKVFKGWSETASTYAIVKKAAALKGVSPDGLNGEIVFWLAKEGDEQCKKAIDSCFNSLAMGIYNLQYIYDPEMIVIGGAISSREEIIEEINKRIEYLNSNISIARLSPRIERCAYSNDANLIGAVYNFMCTFGA
jgi:glucokinase